MAERPSIIIKSSARGGAAELAAHLTADENEHVRIILSRNLLGMTLPDMLVEMAAMGIGSRSRRPFDHVSLSPAPGIHLTDRQVRFAFGIYDRSQRLPRSGPQVIIEHVKNGRRHYHKVALRIDLATMTAAPDGWRYIKNEQAARSIETAFDLAVGTGRFTGRERVDGRFVDERPESWLSQDEHQQAKRLGFDQRAVDERIQAAWNRSDTGRSFAAALAADSFILARGDRRDVVIVDPEGGVHSPRRRLVDGNGRRLKAAAVAARLADLDPGTLPTVSEARQQQREDASHRDTGRLKEDAVAAEVRLVRGLGAVIASRRDALQALRARRESRLLVVLEAGRLRAMAGERERRLAEAAHLGTRRRSLGRARQITKRISQYRPKLDDLGRRLDAAFLEARRRNEPASTHSAAGMGGRGPARPPAAATHKLPRILTGRTQLRMLTEHYKQPVDPGIDPLLRYVKKPQPNQPGSTLCVTLVTGEVLADAGDLITVTSDGVVSAQAVKVFVALVRANGWPEVELFGSNDWITAASKALEAAGIPWSVEGQSQHAKRGADKSLERRPDLQPEPRPHAPCGIPFREPDDGPSHGEPAAPERGRAEEEMPPDTAAPAVNGEDDGFASSRSGTDRPPPLRIDSIGDADASCLSAPDDEPDLGHDPAEFDELVSQPAPRPQPVMPGQDADDRADGVGEPIPALTGSVLAKRPALGAADAALEMALRVSAPPSFQADMDVAAWITQACADAAQRLRESVNERAPADGVEAVLRQGADADAHAGRAGEGVAPDAGVHAHQAVGADQRVNGRPDGADRPEIQAGERREHDPGAAGPTGGVDPRPGGGGREAGRCPERRPAPLAGVESIGLPAVADDPLARPLLGDNPAYWPKPVVAYAEQLKVWQGRKLVPAMVGPVLPALRLARTVVERRGHASAKNDGLGAVDACLAMMLVRIDSRVVDAHRAAVVEERQDSCLRAAAAAPPRQPEAAKPPERSRGRVLE